MPVVTKKCYRYSNQIVQIQSYLIQILVRPPENASTNGIDYETINQAYCNIIAGAALALGMRFAGTANNQAFEALFALTKKLMAISKRSVAELAGKATMEQTICIMVLSLSIGKWHTNA